jgi:hypothetical protein
MNRVASWTAALNRREPSDDILEQDPGLALSLEDETRQLATHSRDVPTKLVPEGDDLGTELGLAGRNLGAELISDGRNLGAELAFHGRHLGPRFPLAGRNLGSELVLAGGTFDSELRLGDHLPPYGRKFIAHLGAKVQNLHLEARDTAGKISERLQCFFQDFDAPGEIGLVHRRALSESSL